jgi:glucose-1-phosphatase
MIKNIVFDLGNVLVRFNPLEWLTGEYGAEDGHFLHEQFCLSPFWMELDLGHLSPGEVKQALCEKFPEKEELFSDCLDKYFGMLTPIPEGIQALEYVASRGYVSYYLTNYHADAFFYLKDTYRWFDSFKGGVCSALCGLVKPDPAIYRLLRDQTGIVPEESLFLDDTKDNIEAAASLGFYTIQVEDPSFLVSAVEQKLS